MTTTPPRRVAKRALARLVVMALVALVALVARPTDAQSFFAEDDAVAETTTETAAAATTAYPDADAFLMDDDDDDDDDDAATVDDAPPSERASARPNRVERDADAARPPAPLPEEEEEGEDDDVADEDAVEVDDDAASVAATETSESKPPADAPATAPEPTAARPTPAPAAPAEDTRAAKLRARLKQLEEMRERARAAAAARPPAPAPADEVEVSEEDLPGMGDGEEAPTIRAPRTLLSARAPADAPNETDAAENAAAASNRRALLMSSDDDDGVGGDEFDAARRSLLATSVSGDNTQWVGFEDTPQRLAESRWGPEVTIARHHGNAHVVRPGGYWQAARFNRVERPRRSKLPTDFGKGSGEGTLSGPRGGINQHDRVGINKASGWPGRLHANERNTDPYPGLATTDSVHNALQPFVVGVTSYTPNRRFQNYQYRPMARVSSLDCAGSATELNGRCEDAKVKTVGKHAFKTGEKFTFQLVLGGDRTMLNMKTYIVGDTVTYDSFTLDATTPIDTKTGTPDVDVASAFIVKMKTPTAANPMPTVGEHEWAYENGDKIRFFVTFSEPVTVTGSPTLKLNTGSHYEAGSADAKATFIGGGYGESKSFWKNNERSPLKSPNEPNNWYEDLYNIHDGGCTMGGFQRDLAAASDCVRLSPGGVCDCAAYSGITKATDAVVKVRRVHSFSPGDLIIIQGVTGLDAGLLNKQHAVGTVSGTGTGGNDMLTFEPPLDLTGKVFDASVAVLGRVNIGHECRSDGAGGASEHGEGYCTFSADVRHRLPTGDSTLLEHTRYAPQLPGPDGGGVVATRKEFQYNEDRVEQYMDNVLAFELTVATGGGAYDQTKGNLGATAGEAMQSNDLEYVSRHALELNGGTIKRACPMTFQIKAITCGVKTVVEVYGRHRLKPGDKIAVEGVVGDNPTTSGKYNAEHIVYAIPKVDNVVDASKFQMDFDTSDPSGLCVNTPTVTPEKSRVRRIKTVADWGDGSVCKFADASLSLPRPGDKMRGVDGYFQSLAYNKDITIGRAYVTNVSSDARDGTYGYHRDEMQARDGNSLAAENFLPLGAPDVLDLKVSFSEPVFASCGVNDDRWSTPEQYVGLRYRVCESIQLALFTKDGAEAGDQNLDATTGIPGSEIFPTAFLHDTGRDPPNVLNFRYVPRRGDNVTRLQYKSELALEVTCAAKDSSDACVSMSHIRRRADNALAGLKLPPTARDVGKCVQPPNAAGEVMCASATADHAYSLAGRKNIRVRAAF